MLIRYCDVCKSEMNEKPLRVLAVGRTSVVHIGVSYPGGHEDICNACIAKAIRAHVDASKEDENGQSGQG